MASKTIELSQVIADFAKAFTSVDATRPVYVSRTGRAYQPGLGPHAENRTVEFVLAEIRRCGLWGGRPTGQFIAYPNAPLQKADVWIGEPLEWVVEVKMLRFRGDNGKPDDTSLKDVLSPYPSDRSALTDTAKLAAAPFLARKGVLIYGFDYGDRPTEPALAAFELLARSTINLGERVTAPIGPLVHPFHQTGSVCAWEVRGIRAADPAGDVPAVGGG